jgi:hypothetical protein
MPPHSRPIATAKERAAKADKIGVAVNRRAVAKFPRVLRILNIQQAFAAHHATKKTFPVEILIVGNRQLMLAVIDNENSASAGQAVAVLIPSCANCRGLMAARDVRKVPQHRMSLA